MTSLDVVSSKDQDCSELDFLLSLLPELSDEATEKQQYADEVAKYLDENGCEFWDYQCGEKRFLYLSREPVHFHRFASLAAAKFPSEVTIGVWPPVDPTALAVVVISQKAAEEALAEFVEAWATGLGALRKAESEPR